MEQQNEVPLCPHKQHTSASSLIDFMCSQTDLLDLTNVYRNCFLSLWPRTLSDSTHITHNQETPERCKLIYRVRMNVYAKRLRWSRGSVLAFGTQVRGFKPGRSYRIFQGGNILSTTSLGREVKPFVPCRRFTACKRSLNVTWKSGIFRQNSSAISRPSSSSFHY